MKNQKVITELDATIIRQDAKIDELEGHIARHRRAALEAEAQLSFQMNEVTKLRDANTKFEEEVTALRKLIAHLFAVIGCLHRYFER